MSCHFLKIIVATKLHFTRTKASTPPVVTMETGEQEVDEEVEDDARKAWKKLTTAEKKVSKVKELNHATVSHSRNANICSIMQILLQKPQPLLLLKLLSKRKHPMPRRRKDQCLLLIRFRGRTKNLGCARRQLLLLNAVNHVMYSLDEDAEPATQIEKTIHIPIIHD